MSALHSSAKAQRLRALGKWSSCGCRICPGLGGGNLKAYGGWFTIQTAKLVVAPFRAQASRLDADSPCCNDATKP